MSDFLSEFKALRVGSKFGPLKNRWHKLAVQWGEDVERLSGIRRTLEDHDRDVRKTNRTNNRKARASTDKVRAQYVTGGCPRSVAAEVVYLSEEPDEAFFLSN